MTAAVELVHQVAVGGSGGVEVVGDLVRVVLELGDAPAQLMVVSFELGGALFEAVEQRPRVPASGDVGVGAETVGQPLTQGGDVGGELADLLFGVASSARRLCSVTSERVGSFQ